MVEANCEQIWTVNWMCVQIYTEITDVVLVKAITVNCLTSDVF